MPLLLAEEAAAQTSAVPAVIQNGIGGAMLRTTGPGKVEHGLSHTGRYFSRIALCNFDVDGHELKPEHMQWLSQHAVPLMRGAGFIYIRGMASRTGSERHNRLLSGRRAEQVLKYLAMRTGQDVNAMPAKLIAVGESESKGGSDENERHRAVELFIWDRPGSPPTPPGNIKLVQRTTKRVWERVTFPAIQRLGRATGEQDGSLGELWARQLSDKVDEFPSGRRKELIPDWQVVVEVRIHSVEERTASQSKETYREERTYIWGRYTPKVKVVHRHENKGFRAKWHKPMEETVKEIPRSEAQRDPKLIPRGESE